MVALVWASFTLIRIDGLDSTLRADARWRWDPSAEDLFLAWKKDSTGSRTSSRPGETISLGPGDWPEFRGPSRDGVIHGIRIATDWDKTPPRPLWQQRIGPAWSSVAVVDGRLFTQEQRDQSEAVVLERYADSEALLEHAAHLGPLGTAILAAGLVSSELLGEPSAELTAKLADGPVRLFTPFLSR